MVTNQVKKIIELLKIEFPDIRCDLSHEKDYELLFAARLSAQCTDKRVNEVTKILYEKYKTLEEIANCDLSDLEEIVHPCGVYKMKAKNIRDAANMLLGQYGGGVPDTMEELLKLPGVGRKTANLILGDIYGKPAVVADTHCIRISNRLGLCDSKDPLKVELRLKEVIPPEEQNDLCHRFVWHGRKTCDARRPLCDVCTLQSCCAYFKARAKEEKKKAKK